MARPILKTSLAGLNFPHPIALAAGFDKDGEAAQGLLELDFSAVEVGTITPSPQKGNRKPRVFRFPEHGAIINHMGFPSDGAKRVAGRLQSLRLEESKTILGVNIGPGEAQLDNPVPALREMACNFAPLANYLTVNLSSPNTEGLRALQAEDQAREILVAVREGVELCSLAGELPVFLKVSSDLPDATLSGAITLAREKFCHGLIIGNTTTTRPDGLTGRHKDQQGGLSGRPLFAPSTERLATAWRMSGGEIPLIGVGGVDSAEAAWQKIICGASLVQIYTGLVYKGHGLVQEILDGLEKKMQENGYDNMSQAVGSAFKSGGSVGASQKTRSASESAPKRLLKESQEKAA